MKKKTLLYFSCQLEIDHVTQQPKETCQRTYRGPWWWAVKNWALFVNNKKRSPKLVFLNENQNKKYSDDFLLWKLTFKVRFWNFLTSPHFVYCQNLFLNRYVDLWPKIYPILYSSHENNSTTHLTIICTHATPPISAVTTN